MRRDGTNIVRGTQELANPAARCKSYMFRPRRVKRAEARFLYVYMLFFASLTDEFAFQATAKYYLSLRVLEWAGCSPRYMIG